MTTGEGPRIFLGIFFAERSFIGLLAENLKRSRLLFRWCWRVILLLKQSFPVNLHPVYVPLVWYREIVGYWSSSLLFSFICSHLLTATMRFIPSSSPASTLCCCPCWPGLFCFFSLVSLWHMSCGKVGVLKRSRSEDVNKLLDPFYVTDLNSSQHSRDKWTSSVICHLPALIWWCHPASWILVKINTCTATLHIRMRSRHKAGIYRHLVAELNYDRCWYKEFTIDIYPLSTG